MIFIQSVHDGHPGDRHHFIDCMTKDTAMITRSKNNGCQIIMTTRTHCFVYFDRSGTKWPKKIVQNVVFLSLQLTWN